MRTLGTLLALPLLLTTACGARTDADVGSDGTRRDCAGSVLGTVEHVQVRYDGKQLCAPGGRVAVPGLDPSTAAVLTLRTGDQLLRVDTTGARRGGFQPWLVAVAGDRPTVLRHHGGSVLPYVATDGGGTPATATCTTDGFVVWTARAAEPPGVVMAWDLTRTPYTLDGTTLTPGRSTVRPDVADPTLRKQMPHLFEPGAFLADC